jgi:hypothetical protein
MNFAALRWSGTFINRKILLRTQLLDVIELTLETFKFEKLFVVHLLNLISYITRPAYAPIRI